MKRVYFIKPIGFDGPIKIGCSYGPVQRMEQLATWSPFPLEILATLEGTGSVERRFHARFVDDHQSREWFKTTPELLDVIAQIKAGTFDVETLPAARALYRGKNKPQRKWTEAERYRARHNAAVRKAERTSGRFPPYRATREQEEAFVADPIANGITEAAWDKAEARAMAAYHREEAREHMREAERFAKPTRKSQAVTQ